MSKISKGELIRRYIFFILGLFVNSLGVACITKANLGTSPITSIPYVLSIGFQPTIGQFTIFWSLILIACQLLLLRRQFQLVQLLQIPVSILFGSFIDFSMDIILAQLNPQSYPAKMISLLIGCAILGFGVFMEVAANVVMLPGEATANAISRISNREFGTVKICVDVSMCIIAILISFALFHNVQGVREGTIIAALLVGFISKCFNRTLGKTVQQLFYISHENKVSLTEEPSEG